MPDGNLRVRQDMPAGSGFGEIGSGARAQILLAVERETRLEDVEIGLVCNPAYY